MGVNLQDARKNAGKESEERLENTMGQIKCNKCGKEIHMQEGERQDDCLKVVKEWGYFSEKDTELHEFYICEPCYDAMIQEFVIPIRKRYVQEVV